MDGEGVYKKGGDVERRMGEGWLCNVYVVQ